MVRVQNVGFNDTIKERDDHECKVCYRNSLNLEVHHIQSVNDYPELQHDENNVITLCGDCHKEFHKMHSNTFFDRRKFENYSRNKRITLIFLTALAKETTVHECKVPMWDSNIIDLYNQVSQPLWAAFRKDHKGMSLPEVYVPHFFEDLQRRLTEMIDFTRGVRQAFGQDVLDDLLSEGKTNELDGLLEAILTSEHHNQDMEGHNDWYYHGGNVLERDD